MPDDSTSVLAAMAVLPTPAMALAMVLAGGALGALFFVGLWWTVQRTAASSNALWWLLGSLALRITIVLPGIYFASAGQPVRLGLCVLGFVLARAVVLRTTRPRPPTRALPAPGSSRCA